MIPKTDKELTRKHDSKNRQRVNQETMIPNSDKELTRRNDS
jgi:aromatic ring hydroxylase